MNEAALRDRVEYLEAENANLRAELGYAQTEEQITKARRAFKIAPQQAKLLIALKDGRQRSFEALRAVLWPNADDEPESNVLHVHVAHLRKGLRGYGINIGTIWAYGWQMSAADCAKVNAILCDEVQP